MTVTTLMAKVKGVRCIAHTHSLAAGESPHTYQHSDWSGNQACSTIVWMYRGVGFNLCMSCDMWVGWWHVMWQGWWHVVWHVDWMSCDMSCDGSANNYSDIQYIPTMILHTLHTHILYTFDCSLSSEIPRHIIVLINIQFPCLEK